MLEDFIKLFKDHVNLSPFVITAITAVGFLWLVYHALKYICWLIWLCKLYIINPNCTFLHENFCEKYGQWAVISGSADGLGLELARLLARRGMSIVLMGLFEEELTKAKATLEGEPNVGEICTVMKDFSDISEENYEELKRLINPEQRDIGILINNVGVYPSRPAFKRFAKLNEKSIRRQMAVNCLGTTFLTKMILPGMIERERGLILNVSSISAAATSPYLGVYPGTKKFVQTLTKQLRVEYSSLPIDFVCLLAGPFLNPRLSDISRENLMMPRASKFARCAFGAISTSCKPAEYCGTIQHEFMRCTLELLEGLSPRLLSYIWTSMETEEEYKLSPLVRKRSELVATKRSRFISLPS